MMTKPDYIIILQAEYGYDGIELLSWSEEQLKAELEACIDRRFNNKRCV